MLIDTRSAPLEGSTTGETVPTYLAHFNNSSKLLHMNSHYGACIHMLLRMMCVQCNMLLGWFDLSMFFLNNFFNDKIFARSLVLYNLL